jgi:hypothetical protein
VNIGLTAVVVLAMLAIPAYFGLFWARRRRIHFTSGISVFLGREMLIIGGLTSFPAYMVAVAIFNWIARRAGLLEVSFLTPARYLLNANAISTVSHDRYVAWCGVFAIFYGLSFLWSHLWVWLMAEALLKKKRLWLANLLEQLGLWDLTTQMLHFTADGGPPVWIDLSQKDDGSTVYVGKLANFVDQGPFQGITLEDVYILRFKNGGREANYRVDSGGSLGRMFFVKEKITNLHFRARPPATLSQDQTADLISRLQAAAQEAQAAQEAPAEPSDQTATSTGGHP